jgi:acetyltransferase-like isoleucine patch superfamily enzyme
MTPSSLISPTARVLDRVRLGTDVTIGDFALVGVAPGSIAGNAPETLIGDGVTIRSHTVIYAGSIIGNYSMTGHGVLIRENTKVGSNVSIGTATVIEHHVQIANGVRIHSQAFIPEYSILEEECWLGPRVCITNAKFPTSSHAKDDLRGVVISRRARIGANVTLLPGVVIGEESLIGAGSVVTKDVPPRAVMVGNPARQIKSISELSYDNDIPDPPYPT